MTVTEKLQQVQLLSDGQVTDADARAGVGGVFSLVDPVRRSTTSSTSRWSSPGCTSRSCSRTTRSTATGRSSRRRSAQPARSTRRSHRPTPPSAPGRRRRSASSRSTRRWWTSRTSRAGAGSPRARARTRTSARCIAAARVQGRPGQQLRRPGQGRGQRQAPGRVRAAGGRPGLQHHGHVRVPAAQPLPAAVQGRDRRRRRHRDVLVQRDQRRARGARTRTPRPTS